MQVNIRPATSAQLSNLTAVANNVKTIDLSWTLPVADPNYRAAQIWVNTINDVDSASLVATVGGNCYSYTAPDTGSRYFWIRTVNTWNRTDGPFTGPAQATPKLLVTADIGVFDLATANIVNKLAVAKITGLGALATLSQVNANTQVTNLGDLAYASSIAANEIGAGTLAAGVVYAGTISANQINTGSMVADRIVGGTLRLANSNFQVVGTNNTIQIYTGNFTRCSLSNGDAPGLPAVTANSYGSGAAIKCNGDLIPNGSGALGTSSYAWTGIYSQTAVTVTSDIRSKKDIADCDLGLDFINSLRPVTYKLAQNALKIEKVRELEGPWPSGTPDYDIIYAPTPGVRTHYGFIAQEVKQALGERDAAMWVLSDKDNPDSPQALRYEELIAPLIKAVQEVSLLVDKQRQRIDELERKILTT